MSSDMEDGEVVDATEIYVSTHAETILKREFLVHFEAEVPLYSDYAKGLIDDFAGILPVSDYGGFVSSAALYRSTSYTIISTNAVLQAENRPLLGELPARHRDTLQALIRLAAALPCVWSSPKHLSHHGLSTLNTLENTSPLTHEPFGTLVALVLTAPSLFCKVGGPARPTNLAKQFTLQCFRATLARALLVTDVTACKSEPMEGQEDFKNADLENLLPYMKELRNGVLEDNLNPTEVWQLIKSQCHTFLRCCCLFYHFLSDINAPEELTVVKGDTWESMCGYLDMPSTFKDLVDTPTARKKISEWAGLSTEWFNGEIPAHVVTEPKEPPSLIPLPEDFSELMNLVSEFSCPNSEREDSKKPTMCLVCGQILCSQSYCCQADIPKWGRSGELQRVGAVVAHCASCGGGAGVFLRVRDCELLLLAAPARGAKLPAPYLDSYGETDQGLRRGNPLQLCPSRYEALRMLWLAHGLHERIARALDTNVLVTTTWQNL